MGALAVARGERGPGFMTPDLSVVLCTHNPRLDYFRRVLDALRAQTLPRKGWELLIIDNASTPPVADRLEGLEARIIAETSLGLTHARLAGIRESKGGVLVFLDDDNLLAEDYLAVALEIAGRWPRLGAWGGQALPEWEEEPEEWTRRYWNWIGVRELPRDLWSNLPNDLTTHPFGAGMCVRREVAQAYALALDADSFRRSLGRTGMELIGSEDSDLCFTASDLGLGNGLFRRLKLTHLIPRNRVQEAYLLRLVEALTFSHTILLQARGIPPHVPSRAQRLLHGYESLFINDRARRFDAARRRGRDAAIAQFTQGGEKSFPHGSVQGKLA